MDTVKEFLDRANEALLELVGLKVKKADTYHQKKKQIMEAFIPEGLRYNRWGISDQWYDNIFDIDFQIQKDERVKYDMAGKIIKSALKPVYTEISTDLTMEKYLLTIKKVKLMSSIEDQKKHIASLENSVLEANKLCASMNEQLQQIELELQPA